jgi:hypothetical protein
MDFGRYLRTYGDPPGKVALKPPAGDGHSDLYDGRTVTLPVVAVAMARGWVCVRQQLGPEQQWLAWVPADRVRGR